MLQNKFEYLVGFFCCVTDSTGKEYTRHYIDKPADSAQRDARSAYNKRGRTGKGKGKECKGKGKGMERNGEGKRKGK